MFLTVLFCVLSPLIEAKYYDLTHEFSDDTVYFPVVRDHKFKLTNFITFGNASTELYYIVNTFCMAEHGGTHVDAPSHFGYGKRDINEIPLNDLIGPAYVVDAVEESKKNKDYLITTDHIQKVEESSGKIPDGSILLFMTGWSKKWPSLKEYLGSDTRNMSLLHFPGLHPDAAKWLIRERKVACIGIDTASIDYGQSTNFKTHTILSKENIPILENVKDIDQVHKKNVTIYALPMKIKGGSGAPMRIIAVETISNATQVVLSTAIAFFAVLANHLLS